MSEEESQGRSHQNRILKNEGGMSIWRNGRVNFRPRIDRSILSVEEEPKGSRVSPSYPKDSNLGLKPD